MEMEPTGFWNKIMKQNKGLTYTSRVHQWGHDERFDDESIGISQVLDMPIDSSFVVPDIWLNDAK